MKKLFLMVSIICAVVFAQEAKQEQKPTQEQPEQQEKEQEWNITADSMEMLMDNHLIEMEGNVLVEDETVRLSAKKMIVHLDANNKLKDIEAFGGVTVRKLDSSESATGNTGFYDATKEEVTLTGNCILLKDKTTLTGDKVVYNRKTNTIGMKRATITLPVKKGSGNIFDAPKKDKQEDATKKEEQPAPAKDEQPKAEQN